MKKKAIDGRGASQKYKGKRGDQEKYFSKTLKWHLSGRTSNGKRQK